MSSYTQQPGLTSESFNSTVFLGGICLTSQPLEAINRFRDLNNVGAMNHSRLIAFLVLCVVSAAHIHTYGLPVPSLSFKDTIMAPLEPSECHSHELMSLRGGATGPEQGDKSGKDYAEENDSEAGLEPLGVLGRVYYRECHQALAPYAMQPFQESSLQPYQWAMYVVGVPVCLHGEYKSFQSSSTPWWPRGPSSSWTTPPH